MVKKSPPKQSKNVQLLNNITENKIQNPDSLKETRLNMNVSTVPFSQLLDLVDILEIKVGNEMLAKEAEVVLTLATTLNKRRPCFQDTFVFALE